MREIDIPVSFPDRRTIVVKLHPSGNVLDLKRAVAKAEAVEVLEAGSNADLLGKKFTAPATFRLIVRGMELSNQGSLEYYHLTTKGKNQPAVRVCPKHESLIDDDEVLEEDFAIPETVAHLEDERAEKLRAEEEAKAAAKARHATFHMQRRKSGSAKGGSSPSRRAGSTSNSPNRATSKAQQQQQQHARRGSDATTATGGPNSQRPESSLTMNSNRSTGATPEPMMPSYQQQQQQQQQQNVGVHGPNSVYPGRVALPPMPDNMSNYAAPSHLNVSAMSNSSSSQQHPHYHTVTNSPTRGLQPLAPSAAAIFAMPIDDGAGGAPLINADGSVSPDILTKMKTYLNAAENGEAPLPQVLPLPSVAGGHLTPMRGGFLAPLGGRSPNRAQQNQNSSINSLNDSMMMKGGGGACPGGSSCANQQKLNDAMVRIQQLEGAVERYKELLHRLAHMEDGRQQQQQAPQQQQQAAQ